MQRFCKPLVLFFLLSLMACGSQDLIALQTNANPGWAKAKNIADAEQKTFANMARFFMKRAKANGKKGKVFFFGDSNTFKQFAEVNPEAKDRMAFNYVFLTVDAFRRSKHLSQSGEIVALRSTSLDFDFSDIENLLGTHHPVVEKFRLPIYDNLSAEDCPAYPASAKELFNKTRKLQNESSVELQKLLDLKSRLGWFYFPKTKDRFGRPLKKPIDKFKLTEDLVLRYGRIDRRIGSLVEIDSNKLPASVRELSAKFINECKAAHLQFTKIVTKPFLELLESESEPEAKLAIIEIASAFSPALTKALEKHCTIETLVSQFSDDPVTIMRLDRLRKILNSCKPSNPMVKSNGLPPLTIQKQIQLDQRIETFDVAPDGSRMALLFNKKHEAEVFDVKSGEKLFELDPTAGSKRARGFFQGGGNHIRFWPATVCLSLAKARI